MTQQELIENARGRAQEAIRSLFGQLGRVSITTLAETAIERRLLDEETLLQCQLSGVSDLCRKTLKRKTEDRLPFAQPTSGAKDAAWVQTTLLSRDELFSLIERRSKALVEDDAELRLLHGFCLRKFGEAPEVPELLVRELVEA